MNALMKALQRASMRMAVWLYRVTNGSLGGSLGGLKVLLLTVAGRTSGIEHSVPVGFFEYNGSYVVVGSAGGAPQDPQWFRNLRYAAWAHIQIRSRQTNVSVRIADAAERDTLWRDVVIPRAPRFASYEKKTARTMPIAVLTPK